MEEKSRNRFAVLIAVILTAAVIYSFAVNLFYETPSVGLATDSGSMETDATLPAPDQFGIRVEITPETVQSVIEETLSRYRSYSRTIQIEYLSGGEIQGSFSADVFVDEEWTRVDLTTPGGVEHTLIGEDACYRWYDDETNYVSLPVEAGMEDLAQRIPTYETVLDLPQKKISAADYVLHGGIACVYVEAAMDEPNYSERYWVSVESGLLVCAETLKGDEVVYRMTSHEVEYPLSAGMDHFVLPDNSVQHRLAE